MAEPSSAIVAFDFDGTLTIKDSFTAFLAWRSGPLPYAAGLARLAPPALAYLLHRDRGRIKAAAAKVYLGGDSRNEIEAAAESFAAATFDRMIRPDARRVGDDWGARGARRVIVTASPELVVSPFARRLGADELIGTKLDFDAKDRATGAFLTPNCRGVEKVRRLEARFGSGLRLAAAYGDTGGDMEMLAIAEIAGFKVFKERP